MLIIIQICLIFQVQTAFLSDIIPTYNLRLSNGTAFRGRVEIFYNETWGTICDESFDNLTCHVICNQLKYRDGICISNNNKACIKKDEGDFVDGEDQIWLNEVKCFGNEKYFGECQFGNWGKNECNHTEDVGCLCEAPKIIGECQSNRHRIIPFDSTHKGIGFAEMRSLDGVWRGICDDYWNHIAADIFCTCLGFEKIGGHSFHALTNIRRNNSEDINLLYNIDCSSEDSSKQMNIWDCGSTFPKLGLCSAATESAAVSCMQISESDNNVKVEHSATCEFNLMIICLKVEHNLAPSNTSRTFIDPICPEATELPYNESAGHCFILDLGQCTPLVYPYEISENNAILHYCVDIQYEYLSEEFEFLENILNPSLTVKRTGCCALPPTQTINGIFLANNYPTTLVYSLLNYNLDVKCYSDSSFATVVSSSTNVQHGQMLYCKITAAMFDSSLLLVVDTCSFVSSKQDDAVNFVFIDNRCSTSNQLKIMYFNLGNLNWGFSFRVPKFEKSNELYLSCHVRLCTRSKSNNQKQSCDRSCGEKKKEVFHRRDLSSEEDNGSGLEIGSSFSSPDQVMKRRRFVRSNSDLNTVHGSGNQAQQRETAYAPDRTEMRYGRESSLPSEEELIERERANVEQLVQSDYFQVQETKESGPIIADRNGKVELLERYVSSSNDVELSTDVNVIVMLISVYYFIINNC